MRAIWLPYSNSAKYACVHSGFYSNFVHVSETHTQVMLICSLGGIVALNPRKRNKIFNANVEITCLYIHYMSCVI